MIGRNARGVFSWSRPGPAKRAKFGVLGVVVVLLVLALSFAAPGSQNKVAAKPDVDGPTFIEPHAALHLTAAGDSAIGLAKGDFNGDGKLDLVATLAYAQPEAGNTMSAIAVMLGQGDGAFSEAARMPVLPSSGSGQVYARGISAKDFDGDGKLDLVTDVGEMQQVYFYKGKGDGAFNSPTFIAAGGQANGLQVGDLNGDNKLDLVTFNTLNNEHSVSVLLGRGNGTFAAPTLHSAASGYHLLGSLVDVDGQHGPDIILSVAGEYISVLLNSGNGGFPAASVDYHAPDVRGLYVADFDRDSKLDIVALSYGQSNVKFMKGNGDGSFQAPSLFSPTEYLPLLDYGENNALDLNGDGKLDIIVGNSLNAISLAFGKGDGTFDTHALVAAPGAVDQGSGAPVDNTIAEAVVTGDFNNDGKLDIAVGSRPGNGAVGGVALLLGAGGGSFAAPRIYPLIPGSSFQGYTQSLLADFTGDGKLDLLVSANHAVNNPDPATILELLPGNGAGGFNSAIGSLAPYYGQGTDIYSLQAVDMNGDGKLDLVLSIAPSGVQSNGGQPQTTIAYNNGAGTFSHSSVSLLPAGSATPYPIRNVVGDFNNDGKLDIAALTVRDVDCCNGSDTHVELFLQSATTAGSFTRAAGYPQTDLGLSHTQQFVAGDYNGDGKLDLLALGNKNSANTEQVMYLQGKGDGAFATPAPIAALPPSNTIFQMRAVDINHDGKLDLVGAIYGGVATYLGANNGTLQAPLVSSTSGSGVTWLDLGDLDGDNNLDAAFVSAGGGFSTLHGHGEGTFSAGVHAASGENNLAFVNVGDLNNDGKLDVVTTKRPNTAASFAATVLINNTGGTTVPTATPTATRTATTGGAQIICIQSGVAAYDPGAPCTNNNSSLTLQQALDAAGANGEVRLARGDYLTGAIIGQNVAINGGYPGGSGGFVVNDFNANESRLGNLTINATVRASDFALYNNISGSGTLNLGGAVNWKVGLLYINVTNVTAGAVLNILGQGGVQAGTLNNNGIVRHNSNNAFDLSGKVINNGLYEVRQNLTLRPTGSNRQFVNMGVLRKPADVGDVYISLGGAGLQPSTVFSNGAYQSSGTGYQGQLGIIDVEAGKLLLQNGVFLFMPNSGAVGAGALELSSNATLRAPFANLPVYVGNLSTTSSSVVDGLGALTIRGVFNWQGGIMADAGQTIISDKATVNLANAAVQLDERRLNNFGLFNVNGLSVINLSSAASINNIGTLRVNAPVGTVNTLTLTNRSSNLSVTSTVTNFGTMILQQSNAGGISLQLNSGIAFVSSGNTASGDAGLLDIGSQVILNGGTFTQTGPGHTNLNGGSISKGNNTSSCQVTLEDGLLTGAGVIACNVTSESATINPSSATAAGQAIISIDGNYTQGRDATLKIDVGYTSGPDRRSSQLLVGGKATLAGTLLVNAVYGYFSDRFTHYSPTSFKVLTFSPGNRVGDFDDLGWQGSHTYSDRDLTINITSIPSPGTPTATRTPFLPATSTPTATFTPFRTYTPTPTRSVTVQPTRSGTPPTSIPTNTATLTPPPASCVPGFSPMSIPFSAAVRLYGISAITANDVWTVGNNTAPLSPVSAHFNGSVWTQVAVPNPGGAYTYAMLRAVAAVSTNNVWAVGSLGRSGASDPYIIHWNGTAWSQVTTPTFGNNFAELDAISAHGTKDIWATGKYNAGANTLILHYNGSTWSQVTSVTPSGELNNLQGVSIHAASDYYAASDVWAVGYYQNVDTTISPLIERWNGANWSLSNAPTIPGDQGSFDRYYLNGVYATSNSDAWAVGYAQNTATGAIHEYLIRWNGASWSFVVSPTIPQDFKIQSVWASDSNNVWFVGNEGASSGHYYLTKLHWDGSNLSVIREPVSGGAIGDLSSVTGAGGVVYTAGPGDTAAPPVIERLNNCAPTATPTPVGPTATPTAGSGQYTYHHVDGLPFVNGGVDVGNHCDDCVTTFFLLKPVQLYDRVFTSASVSSNGILAFQTNTNSGANTYLPNNNISFAIAAYWNDLTTDCEGCGVFITVVLETQPEQPLYVEWRARNKSGQFVNFEVELFSADTESRGGFNVLLNIVPNYGASATIGVQRSPGDGFYTQFSADPSGNNAAAAMQVKPQAEPVFDGDAIVFDPPFSPAGANTPTPGAASSTPTFTLTATATATISSSPTPCLAQFGDVHASDYFYQPVLYLACRGVISGYSDATFRPYNNTTRGQLSKIVVLAQGWQPVNPGAATFSDVPVGSTFFTFVETAVQHGIISGYADHTFKPNNNVTRGQLSKIIVLARGWALINPVNPTFVDVTVGSAFYQVVETAAQHGIISGYNLADGRKEFRVGANATRGQIAKIVFLAVTSSSK